MGAYHCLECQGTFCHHEVNCYEYKDGLICEKCYQEKGVIKDGTNIEL